LSSGSLQSGLEAERLKTNGAETGPYGRNNSGFTGSTTMI
jgi:hypothetical protein